MGYTGAMFVAAFVLSLPVLLITAVPFRIASLLGAVPAGFAGIPAYLLIAIARWWWRRLDKAATPFIPPQSESA